jgi:glutamate dehydrogenase
MADTTRDLLTEAALSVGTAPGVGDVPAYLRAYYRHVADDDLAGAGAERLGEVAGAQARLAGRRPQGRAIVEVRPGEAAALSAGSDVIDIVTDDMPYLVDSITMELAKHGLSARLVVHPQLRVRRDVSGVMREVAGLVNGVERTRDELAHDELAESWTHIEVARLGTGEAKQLADDLDRVLSDVRVAVEDASRMQARALDLAQGLVDEPPGPDAIESDPIESDTEIGALLRWMSGGRFLFLGYREYDLVPGEDGTLSRAVAGTGLGILRHDTHDPGSFAALPPVPGAQALDPHRLIVTKANSRSTVHRDSYLDYVAIKRIDSDGRVTGEHRFLGLYTHVAFTESITAIPVLRRKLAAVLDATGTATDSFDGAYISEVLEFYPREELFMASVPELTTVASGVLRLRERRQTRLFLRRDIYGRYISCLVYLPRDRYTTQVRLRAQEVLRRGLNCSQVDYSVLVGESPVARLHIVVRADRGQPLPVVDTAKLERAVAAAARSWDDDFATEALRACGEQGGRALLNMVADVIPQTYKTDVPPAAAVSDLRRIWQLRESGENVAFELWESQDYIGGVPIIETSEADRPPADARRVWRLTIYRTGGPITLTDVLPRLQHMGVDVVDEHPYEFPVNEPFWIYDFGLRRGPES